MQKEEENLEKIHEICRKTSVEMYNIGYCKGVGDLIFYFFFIFMFLWFLGAIK